MFRNRCWLLLAALALSPAVAAQYINRAVWLGRELEGVRPDYERGAEYYLDRASYVDVPPWWFPALDPFANRLFVAGGSVSTDRLTLEAVGAVGVDVGSGFVARLDYLQSEHVTAQFQRVAVGFDARLTDATAVFVQLEGTPDKSRADLSLGAELFRSAHGAHRVTFTLVDFAWRKSDEFEYTTPPFGLLFAGAAGDPDGFEVAYEVGVQLPFEERTAVDSFGMDRMIGEVAARWRVGARDRLVLACGGELTAKELRQEDPAAAEREDYDTRFGRVRLEWWRSGDDGRELSIGASWLGERTDGDRPNAPAEDLTVRRDELMLLARARWPIGSSWAVEPYVIGGRVDYLERDGTRSDAFLGFQGKWGVPFRFAFSPRASVRFDVSFQLDEPAFGGGGVQFMATF